MLIKIFAIMSLLSALQFNPYRRILIYGKDSLAVKQQLRLLKSDSAGVAERDIRIEVIKAGSYLIKQYNIESDDFTIILFGKDGGEKFRSLKPEEAKLIFSIIDQMPMRRQEIARKKNRPTF